MTDTVRAAGIVKRSLERSAALVSRVPARRVVSIAGVLIVVLVAFGIAQRTVFPDWRLANLDTEASIATWFSATLLWGVAAAWLLVASNSRPGYLAIWVWCPLLAWLALDDGSAIHERLERWSGVDWQLLYLPILATGAAAWWGLLRRYRSEREVASWLVGGAVAWAVALLLELIQNWGGPPARPAIYDPLMIIEEGLEMVGSTALLVAAVVILNRSRSAPVARQ